MISKKMQHNNASRILTAAIILAAVLFAAVIRLRLLEVPFERDEGEYAYIARLLLKGVPLYKEAYSMKMPGIYAVYAVIMSLFGQTIAGVHLGLLLVNALTIILIYLLGKKLFGALTGAIAGAVFAVMSLGPAFQGVFANAEHFVLPFVILGAILLLKAADSRRPVTLFVSGLAFGAGFIIKQHGAFFIAFAFTYLAITELMKRPSAWRLSGARLAVFLCGAVIPFAAVCLIISAAGTFDKFWFFTFSYAREYVSLVPLRTGFEMLNRSVTPIINYSPILWIFTVVGLSALLRDKNMRPNNLFIESFFIFSFLSVCPGLFFRPHYFLLILPAASLSAAAGITSLSRQKKAVSILLATIVILYAVQKEKYFFFKAAPDEASRMVYGFNPFPESLEIAKYIKANSSEGERIAILGSEPQICFYSNRRSASGYLYTYPLLEGHKYSLDMQREMIKEIEDKKPKFIIFVNIFSSGCCIPQTARSVHTWFEEYRQDYYEKAGVVDLLPAGSAAFWDGEAFGYTPHSIYWIAVFRRKS